MRLINEHLLKNADPKCYNGCGSKGFGWMVPDRWFFVDFEIACNIHDIMYNKVKTGEFCKEYADSVFYENLQIINKEKSPTWLGRQIRKPIIYAYYLAVVKFGKNFVK